MPLYFGSSQEPVGARTLSSSSGERPANSPRSDWREGVNDKSSHYHQVLRALRAPDLPPGSASSTESRRIRRKVDISFHLCEY